MPEIFDLRAFSAENLRRCEAANGFRHPIDAWTHAEWIMAIAGELGEVAGLGKEISRNEGGYPNKGMTREAIVSAMADEIADVAIYLDLFAQSLGIDLATAIRSKFDRTSAKVGYGAGSTP